MNRGDWRVVPREYSNLQVLRHGLRNDRSDGDCKRQHDEQSCGDLVERVGIDCSDHDELPSGGSTDAWNA
jgi:hypothetical protein